MKLGKAFLALSLLSFFVSASRHGHGQLPGSLRASNVDVSFELDTIPSLNSEWSEFAPVIHKGRVLFTSDRQSDLLQRNMESWSRNSYLSLFWVDIGAIFDSVAFRNVRQLSNKINVRDHTGPLTFSPDHETAIFTRVGDKAVKTNGKRLRKPALFKASYKDGDWEEIQRLPFSKKEYSHAHPTLSGDGERLIFASDRGGGPGKIDLFISEKSAGDWGDPEPLPESINSSAKDVFPYLRDSALFFASDRKGGKGGLDIYCSFLNDNGEWESPIHFDPPLNSSSDDFGMLLKKNGESGYISSDREGGKGKDDIYRFKVIEDVTVQKEGMAGRFRYRQLDGDYPEGRKVELLDDEGEVVMTTETDSSGRFRFKKLPGDKNTTIRLKDSDADVELVMKEGQKGVRLMKDGQGRFVYRKLKGEQIGTKQLKELSDPALDSAGPAISGQFVYERLPSKKAGKRVLQVINDEGEVVMNKKTDKNGNFSLQELPGEQNKRLKLKNVPDDDLTMMVYDDKGKVVAQLKSGDDGIFEYRKLSGERSKKKLLDTEEPELERRPRKTVYGKFDYEKLETDVPDGMKIKVMNEEGKVQFVSKADTAGYFRFVNMALKDSMMFDVTSSKELEGDMVIKIMDRYREVIAVLHKNKNGFFVYRTLEGDSAEKRLKEVEDSSELTMKETEKDSDAAKDTNKASSKERSGRFRFGSNSSYLNDKSKAELRNWAEEMKGGDRKLLIEGHASGIGSEDYNDWLSKRRVQRIQKELVKMGIDASRLQVKWYGEDRLLNDCVEKGDCSEKGHAKNRRVEISYR